MNPPVYPHWREKLVSVIIPVLEYKRRRMLRHPLASRRNLVNLLDDIGKIEAVDLEVIIICNSSDDELIELVKTHDRINKSCINSMNVGVSRSWNMGAMMAEGEFLCFVNDDVELGSTSISQLVEIMESDKSIGQVGPAGRRFSISNKHGPDVGLNEIEDADQVLGWLFLLKREVFDRTGGFDVAYTPAGYEDVDMSFLVRQLGYRSLAIPDIPAVHHGYAGVSSRNTNIEFMNKTITTASLDERNSRIFEYKWKQKDS